MRLAGLAGTFLGDMDEPSLARVLAGASISEFAPGASVFSDGAQPRLGVVIDGIARSFIVGADGRQLTLRYIRSPAVLTTASTAIALNPVPISNEAVTDLTVLELNIPVLVELFEQDTRVGYAFANELSRRFTDVYRSFSATFFGSLRERLAAHLLQAAEPVPGKGLIAQVSQTELAEALGSVREVVGRALRQMQTEGLIVLRHRTVEIVDVTHVLAAAGRWGFPPRLFAIDVSGHADDSFDKLAQPVIGFDPTLSIVYGNTAVPATFGIERNALIGRNLSLLLNDEALNSMREVVEAFVADSTPRTIALPANLTARRSDGSDFPVEITAVPVHRREAVFVFATFVDVSYRQTLSQLAGGRPVARNQVAARGGRRAGRAAAPSKRD